MKTTTLKPTDLNRKWHLIDLDGQILGRVSTEIAKLLMGKGKTLTGAHLDNGDYVVAINSDKIKVTGRKLSDKIYYSHSGFPGGLKDITLQELLSKDSRKVIEKSVKGMLPKNKHQQDRQRHPYSQELGLNKKTEK
ncbi:MAG: 50S ribosomal protein L13 [Candidatus Collierbacteria bacterium GW2011_GWF2_42_51]|nr:MAG: 50S ribosomal protein L13 [Candidatus Collierbacteria bacterium GW2011_GWF2_42_51]